MLFVQAMLSEAANCSWPCKANLHDLDIFHFCLVALKGQYVNTGTTGDKKTNNIQRTHRYMEV